MEDFNNAVILITGAASGIGASLATRLASGGAKKLVLVDRDEDRMRDFAFSLPCERQLIVGDVADENLWNHADLTGLTHAVVNAGIGAGSTIVDTSLADWRQVMSVNLDGAFLTLQAAMRAIKAGGAGGAIVLTASVAGIKAEPGIAAYGASKAAVIHLARIAAREGVADGIRVNSIAPGGVETPIWSNVPFFQELVRSSGSEEAAFLTLQAAMRAIKAGGAGGAIVLTASVAGIKAEPGIAAYGASKAAVIHLARIAAREGVTDGIRVNSIAPGGVETPIWSNVPFFQELVRSSGSEEAAFKAMGKAATPIQRFAQPEEIAEQIAFLLSDKTAYVTGSCLVSDGGYSL